ncbi:hypothetical protein M0P65_01755 [Candidatus Gracilibacteria bacterium]|jgi:hypothetical protein|nr:hypothetical protein [Candidatus Gracilibacteria bacterium]
MNSILNKLKTSFPIENISKEELMELQKREQEELIDFEDIKKYTHLKELTKI